MKMLQRPLFENVRNMIAAVDLLKRHISYVLGTEQAV